jgi:ribose 5-phosphate isomerase A
MSSFCALDGAKENRTVPVATGAFDEITEICSASLARSSRDPATGGGPDVGVDVEVADEEASGAPDPVQAAASRARPAAPRNSRRDGLQGGREGRVSVVTSLNSLSAGHDSARGVPSVPIMEPDPTDPRAAEKRLAAEAAAEGIRDGQRVGLGTGSTVAHFLPALARRGLQITCVSTSPETELAARALGMRAVGFDAIERLDVAVDGADQVAPDRWLVKGGHGAQTREKIVAAAAERFVVIVSSDKLVEAIGPPIPLEVMRFGLAATLRHVTSLGPCRARDGDGSPDGNAIIDFLGEVSDPADLAAAFEAIPGVVEHGLFPPALVSEVIIAYPDGSLRRL